MARPIIAFVSLILVAGAIVMQFFVILSGGVQSSPENKIYFLEADTGGIPNARNPSRWTYWAICSKDSFNGANSDCGSPVAALPFDPKHKTNFGTTFNLPEPLQNGKRFYYLSRFAWVFYLLALIFAATAFFAGALALCTRIGAYLSGFLTFIALGWQTLAAALMTAWTIQGRKAFKDNGQGATLGRNAYGFSWAPVALLFLATLTFCLAGGSRRERTTTPAARRGFFRRHRSVRSRKEEYA